MYFTTIPNGDPTNKQVLEHIVCIYTGRRTGPNDSEEAVHIAVGSFKQAFETAPR